MDLDLDKPRKVEPVTKLKFIPDADKTTMLATATQIENSCGVFVLSLAELRPVKVHFPDERFKDEASAFVEIGRFALSPIALANLKKNIAVAEANYVRLIGPSPDPEVYAQTCEDLMTEDYKRSLAPRPMGFRLPDVPVQSPSAKVRSSENS